ncbi:ATP-binding protein [Thermosynechococcus sp. B0]|nr:MULTISPECIES: ATP-binding protein [unclassified Thermosynechococcus]WJI23219.1 ATP-binding protein [Thermosynechococcus sp. B0]WKT82823.1 ATP-binding protein [Thermosynechococcus sp. HY596]WNC61950.1 ATP-binding protein [Thermosynechococcus sp. HY591]
MEGDSDTSILSSECPAVLDKEAMVSHERQAVRHLLVLEDSEGRRPILLEAATYSIGRDPTNSIVLHSKMVSRQHAILLRVTSPETNSHLFRLIDGDLQGKRSTNGTLVNGQRIVAHDLRSGDMIVFGGDVRARYLTLTNMTDTEFQDFCRSTDVLGFLSKSTNPFATLVPLSDGNIENFSEAALVRLASYPELTPNPILEVDLEGRVTYLNPAAVMQFRDLQQQKLTHPLLLGLPELARYMKQTQEKVHMREVEYQGRIYEQSIHYIYESELIRSYVMDVTDRKRAEEQLRNQARREAIINRIIQAMRTTMVAAEVLQITADLLLEALGSTLCLITQTHAPNSPTYASRPQFVSLPNHLIALNQQAIALFEPALSNGEQVVLAASCTDLPQPLQTDLRTFNVNALVITPLIYLGQLLGQITLLDWEWEPSEATSVLASDRQLWQQTLPKSWTPEDLSLVKTIADQCALAIHQAQLYQQVQELNADLERQVRARTAELEQKMQELERLNAIKDDFLSTVSHELRTPMANMKMAIYMLKQFATDDRQKRYLDILANECNRETELINDLLDLQRLEAGRSQIQQEVIDLDSWLPSVLEPFRNRMQQRQQSLEILRPATLPPLLSNRHALARILAELLNNACKYSPAGAQIVVRFDPIGGDRLQIQVSNPSEIPSEELPRIFEKFYRIPNADPWQQGGTGLGLALTQKLVEQLQGEISADSEAGITTFTLSLPTASGDPAA